MLQSLTYHAPLLTCSECHVPLIDISVWSGHTGLGDIWSLYHTRDQIRVTLRSEREEKGDMLYELSYLSLITMRWYTVNVRLETCEPVETFSLP